MFNKMRRRDFSLDPSCKLFMPVYRYGGEQPKWWDQSGNNNHGTIVGTIPTSPIGWYFDGVDDIVTTGKALSTFITADAGTFLVWVMPMNVGIASGIPDGCAYIIGDAGYMAISFGLVGAYNKIWFFGFDTTRRSGGVAYTVGQWCCLAWVHSGGRLYGYKDGILVVDTALGSLGSLDELLTIGAKPNPDQYSNIILGDILGFNRDLIAQEIRNYYELTRPICGV